MIKLIKFSLILLMLTFFNACNDDYSPLIYNSDLEKVKFWNNECNNVQTVIKYDNAHSGEYVSVTDSSSQYSYMFKAKMGDMHHKPFLKVNASVWIKVKTRDAKATAVLSIDSKDGNVKWEGLDIAPAIVNANEWTEVKHQLIFDNDSYNSEYTLTFFIWNRGNYEVMVDDISLKFMD
jgi:hypothetical protein